MEMFGYFPWKYVLISSALLCIGCCPHGRAEFREGIMRLCARQERRVADVSDTIGQPDLTISVSDYVAQYEKNTGMKLPERVFRSLYFDYVGGDRSLDLAKWRTDEGFLSCQLMVYDERLHYKRPCGYPVAVWMGGFYLVDKKERVLGGCPHSDTPCAFAEAAKDSEQVE